MNKKSPVSRSGRFAGGPAADVAHFTESISFDWRLWRQDILGSMAHATMLRRVGVLTGAELNAILKGLDAIAKEIMGGRFRWRPELEDVHMNIEAELTRRVPAGAKLHTGRSRNDQVALDLRLWLRDEILGLGRQIRSLQRALVGLGETPRRRADPRLHASATRPAGLLRPPSAGVRRNVRPRSPAAGGLLLAGERLPARQRRPRRFHAAAQPLAGRRLARLCRRERPAENLPELDGRREPTGISPSNSAPWRRCWPCICRAWPKT